MNRRLVKHLILTGLITLAFIIGVITLIEGDDPVLNPMPTMSVNENTTVPPPRETATEEIIPTADKRSNPINNVPVIMQNGTENNQRAMPSGCEATSATMLLNYYGYDIAKNDFADIIPCRTPEDGYHPNTYFIGSPYGNGYGVYLAPVILAMEKVVYRQGGGHIVKSMVMCTEAELFEAIDNGHPIVAWATINLSEPKDGTSWTLRDSGETFTWISGEHCMVITGYTEKYIYVNDPLKGAVAYDRMLFIKRWQQLGCQAIIMEIE